MKANNQTVVVLLPQEDSSASRVDRRLKEDGYITWRANDVCHVMEELSDFTVEKRPHIVLLTVNCLSQRFEIIRSALKTLSGTDMTVLGYESRRAQISCNQHFAHDLEQLESLINKERRSSSPLPL